MKLINLLPVLLVCFCAKSASKKMQYISVSSFVPPYRDFRFGPDNLSDKNLSTCWQYKKSSDAAPHILTAFDSSEIIRKVRIANGWQMEKNREFEDLFKKNGRVKRIKVSFSAVSKEKIEYSFDWVLEDQKGWQEKNTDWVESVKFIRIDIFSDYSGIKWPNDVALSEVDFLE